MIYLSITKFTHLKNLISNYKIIMMIKALKEAERAFKENEVPVGAVIINYKTNKIIAKSHNLCEKLNDPTAHAELIAIRSACKIIESNKIPMCDLYVTLEPCLMCASAISFARIRRLYFGAYNIRNGAIEHGSKIFFSGLINYLPEVYGGIKEKQSQLLLKSFFLQKRYNQDDDSKY